MKISDFFKSTKKDDVSEIKRENLELRERILHVETLCAESRNALNTLIQRYNILATIIQNITTTRIDVDTVNAASKIDEKWRKN